MAGTDDKLVRGFRLMEEAIESRGGYWIYAYIVFSAVRAGDRSIQSFDLFSVMMP